MYKGTVKLHSLSESWSESLQIRAISVRGSNDEGDHIYVGPLVNFDDETGIATALNGDSYLIEYHGDRKDKYSELIKKRCNLVLN